MERLEAEDLLRELESYSPRQFDLMNPLVDLTSGRKDLMSKYLGLHEEEPWPLLAEYFGVALAFAALGALIRGATGTRVKEDVKDSTDNPIPQRTALQTMLKGAMERLQYLAQNAQDSQERLLESTEAKEKDSIDWEEEKIRFLQRIADAEEEVKELKKRRGEDAKANEKVVRIYANREHGWKIEKKKLRHEIDMLRKDLIHQEASGLCSPRVSSRTRHCDECDRKERRLIELEKILKDKEFIIMSAMDDARSREAECRELTSSLVAEKVVTAELNQRLDNEMANSAEREKILDEVREREQKSESRLVKVEEELQTTKSHLEALRLATEDHSATTQKLLKESAILRQESEDKDVMISTMLERATVEREEKEDLAREIAAAVTSKQTTEAEAGRWKRLVEERNRQNLSVEVPDARSGHRSHRSLGNRSELDGIADLQKSHVEEVNNLRGAFRRQVEALEKQVAGYRAKAQGTASSPIRALVSADLLEPLADPAFKAWFEVVKGRFATQLEEKHWNQIETFERHLRAKDERLHAFRSKIIMLESELAHPRTEERGYNSVTSAENSPTDVKTERNSMLTQNTLKDVECAGCVKMSVTHQQSMEKLRGELKNARDKLDEQNAEHMATVEKMTENFHAELQHKDVQVAVLEAKLCQVQLQLEEARLANDLASSDKSEEEMFLDNIDETPVPQLEVELYSTSDADAALGSTALEHQVKTMEGKEPAIRCEEFIKLDDSVSDSAKLLSRLKDMCLKEEKPPAMIRFHRKLELETADSLIFSTDDCWLTAEQKTGEMQLQFLPADDIPLPEKVVNPVCEDKNVTFTKNSLRSQCARDSKTLVVHKKAKKGVNKQPLSPDAILNAQQKFDGILFTQAPSKGTRPARLDMCDMLEEQKSQRTLFTEIEGLQSPITNPTFIQESDDKLDFDDERKKSRTREDIQVLGLALEVRRIEQQLSKMNASIGDAQNLLARSVRSVKTPVEKPKRYTGLAGKVSQLAKQIGLSRPRKKAAPKPQTETVKRECSPAVLQSDLCVRKNPLFTQESSAGDLASLQKRAEKVGENLSAIQARLAKEKSPDYYERYKPSLFPKGKLVDTVRTHLSQVQGALHSKLTQTTTNSRRPLSLPAPKPCSTPTKSTAFSPRKISPPARQSVLTPRKLSTPTKPAIPARKPLSPTNSASIPSPRRITSTKLLTPSPRSFTPAKPSTQALSPSERRGLGSPTKPTQVHPKTPTMRDLIKADPRSRAAFGRRLLETKTSSIPDQQPRQWARKTSTHYELDLEHLR